MKILIIEDSEDDLQLILHTLKTGGFNPSYRWVRSLFDLGKALRSETWDAIISDFSLPEFTALDVLRLVQKESIKVPFFVVSGTIGEAVAVEVMRAGAHDYVMKDNLSRLAPAIQREIGEFSARRLLEAQLKKKDEELLHSQKMEAVGRLAGGIAHDFNNFLGVVMLASEQAAAKLGQHEAATEIRQIQWVTQRAAALTRQLLVFSRQRVIEPQAIDINESIKSMLELFQRILGADIKFDLQLCSEPIPLLIDPCHMEQTLMNLVVNARDAMPKGGTIRLNTDIVELNTAKHQGSYCKLTVTDTGTGMSEETRRRVFEPFFTTKAPDKGTGLGLSTVFGIVEQAKGLISVESKQNVGTTFTLHFPLNRAAAAKIEPAAIKAPVQTGTETILLVEDQKELRTVIRESLQMKNYTVLAAESVQDAIQIAGTFKERIHLVITDLVMPDINGIELAKRLRALRSDIRILIMSGYLDANISTSDVEAITSHFLQKPFSMRELLTKVRRALDDDVTATAVAH